MFQRGGKYDRGGEMLAAQPMATRPLAKRRPLAAYSAGPSRRARADAASRVRTRRAGVPTIKLLSGNSLPSVTKALAPTKQLRPILAPFKSVAPIPTRLFSPIVQPCRIA